MTERSGEVRGFSHVAIGVRDMDRSLEFYGGVLGLHVDADATELIGGDEAHPLRRRGVYLRWSADDDAPFLVLDEHLDAAAPGKPKQVLRELGFHHFCFRVSGLDAVVERARAAGVEIFRGPTVADSKGWGLPAGGRVASVFLADPDGNAVQLDEFLTVPA